MGCHAGAGPRRVGAQRVHVGPGDGVSQPSAQLPGQLPVQLRPQTLHLRRAIHLLKKKKKKKSGGTQRKMEREKETEMQKKKENVAAEQSAVQPFTVMLHSFCT